KMRKANSPLNQILISGFTGIRTTLAITKRADVDDFWIMLHDIFVCQTNSCHGLRAYVIDDNISTFDQSEDSLAGFRAFEIQCYRSLVAIDIHEHVAHALVAIRPYLPGYVPMQSFNLDHFS